MLLISSVSICRLNICVCAIDPFHKLEAQVGPNAPQQNDLKFITKSLEIFYKEKTN